MTKTRYLLLILLAISALLFLVNVFGKGVFLNLTLPAGRTLVIAASQGVCHLALTTEEMDAEPVDPELDGAFLNLVGYREWINLGPLQLSTENRLDPMSPFRFAMTRGGQLFDYSSIEFPWLLLIAVLLGWFFLSKRKLPQAGESAVNGREAMSSTTDPSFGNEVMIFVAGFISTPVDKISPKTTLFGDLRIDGDDGVELLEAFKDRFEVDMGPYRAVHFGPEGFSLYAPFYWLLLLWRKINGGSDSTPESRARLHPITVQDLIDSAQTKRWTVRYSEY